MFWHRLTAKHTSKHRTMCKKWSQTVTLCVNFMPNKIINQTVKLPLYIIQAPCAIVIYTVFGFICRMCLIKLPMYMCGTVITLSIFSLWKFSQWTRHTSPVRYGVSFVNKNSDSCSAPVTLEQYKHYTDVIMTTMAPQITSLAVVYSIVYSGGDQRKHQSSASLAFVRGIHRDRWIPRTKGQLRGKCFHFVTSSWYDGPLFNGTALCIS